jgi:ferric-dicitrate binding protein FerR (iron transport regulator)
MGLKDIKIIPQWDKNKEAVWDEMFANPEENKQLHTDLFRRISRHYYVAAAIAVLIVCTLFSYTYTITENTGRNDYFSFDLPDGSLVSLNADSEVKYKPYWWFIKRQVEMKGEAYFEVKKGKRFTVISADNTVRVLGTTFNVLAREEVYQVSCLKGKIEVSTTDKKTLLTGNMRLTMIASHLRIDEDVDTKQSVGWMENSFSFNGVPLSYVISEIERQYNIHITSESELDYYYTGNFSKDKAPEEILEIIGKPFDIHFSIVE